MKQMLLALLINFCITHLSVAETIHSDKDIQVLLTSYYLQDKETLVSNKVIDVAQVVVNNRKDYSQNMIAKAFSLLSDVAFNRGNLLSALQFAQYGSETDNTDVQVQLDVLLKIARGYYTQSKYVQLLSTSEKAGRLAEQAKNMNYHLQALAYSAVAYALSTNDALAVTTLNKIEKLLSRNLQSVDRITLLDIIAEAHFNLAEYDNAIELLDRALKLREDMSKTQGSARTYQLLANAYYQLQQYDDAYNAFWQSLQFAKQDKLNIRVANAELGLGQVLYEQQQFSRSQQRLLDALAVFNSYNLVWDKLSAKITLAKVMYALDKRSEADLVLLSAQSLAEKLLLTPQQIELYLLLTDYYYGQKQFEQAIEAHKHYLTLYKKFHPKVSVKQSLPTAPLEASSKAKKFALNLAEQSQLSLEFNDKFDQQQLMITLLSVALGCSAILVVFWRFRLHQQRLNRGYDEVELPQTHVAQPTQTKRWYQQQYKMARKYNYPISVGYLTVENWQELSFHFNRQVLIDVCKTLAVIINENIDEEDFSGVISEGEYLFLCPHQTEEQALIKLTRINQAIKTRLFANLGDYSVKVHFSVDAPTIQDIDPYVFLSRLSDSV